MRSTTLYSFGSRHLCLVLAAPLLYGCGNDLVQESVKEVAVAGDETLNSTIEVPDWGTFELLTTGQNSETGKYDFVVRTTRSVSKNQLRFVWDFGNGPEGEGPQQSYGFDQNGTYLITVTAYGVDNSVAFVLKLTIDIGMTGNQAPISVSSAEEQVAENDLVFLYGGTSSDPDGDKITYQWVQLDGPHVQIIHAKDASASFITPLVDEDEELKFRLTVSDGKLTGYSDVVVLVTNLLEPSETPEDEVSPEGPENDDPTGVDINGDGTVDTEDSRVNCIASTPEWRNLSFFPQTGTFEIGFIAIPKNAYMDAVIGLSTSSSTRFSGSAVLVRFNTAGLIDVRNGATYDAKSQLNYSVDVRYLFRVVVNVPARTYSVYVTPDGQTEIKLAIDYGFRTEQNTVTNLGFWNLWSETGTILNLCNLRLTASVLSANAGADVTVSPGGSTALNGTAFGGQGPYTYRWSPTTGLSNPSIANPTATPSATTTYTLTVTDVWGSTSTDAASVIVRTATTVAANAGADKQIIAGGSTQLAGSVSGGSAPYTFKWSPSTGLSSTTAANPTCAPSESTTYTLTVTDSAGNTGSDTVSVTVTPSTPTLTANAGTDKQIITGGSTQLSGSATGGTPPYSYKWSPGTGLNNANVAMPVTNPTTTTVYTLTVTDNAARQASDQVIVTVSTDTTPTGTVFIVATGAANASDSNPGTTAAPWKTLAKAASVARAGQTVLVKAGIYYETLKPSASGTAGNLITFKAYPGDECKGSFAGTKSDCRVVIDGQNIRDSGIDGSPRKFIRFEGFEIRNHKDDAVYLHGYYDTTAEGFEVVNNLIHHSGNDAITFRGDFARNILIENNEITENPMTAISSGGGSGHIIRGNNIHYNGKDGIRGGGNNLLIEHNHIYNQFHTDLHQDGMDLGDTSNTIIRYNTISDLTQLIYFHDFDNGGGFSNIQLYGNVFFTDRYMSVSGGETSGIFFDARFHNSPVRDIKIHSNTFAWTGYDGLWVYGGVQSNILVRNNIFYDSGMDADSALNSDYNIFYNSGRPSFEGSHSITGNPKFVNYVRHSAWDFRLQPGSPAIDHGDPTTKTLLNLSSDFKDINSTLRPQGTACDIGAFERTP